MNVRTVVDTVKLRSGFGIHFEEQQHALEKMKMLVRNTYWRGKKGNLPFEKGILCGIKSIIALQKDIKDCGYKYILTSRTNSDCVENIFSCIRGLGGPNNNPDRLEAMQRAKIRMLSTNVDHIVPISNPNVEAVTNEQFVTENLQGGRGNIQRWVDREFLEEQRA